MKSLAMAVPRSTATSAAPRIAPARWASNYWVRLLVCILAVKALLFCFDHSPMFFLGDSVSYLCTATDGYIPPDRSFLYGWLVRCLAVSTGTLTTLLVAQILATAGAALLCSFILRRYFGVSAAVAGVVGMLCAIEPLELLYERYVMTEAFSLLVFAWFTVVAMGSLKGPSLGRMALLQGVGILLVSLRVSFLPAVQAATVLVPVLGLGALSMVPGWLERKRFLVELAERFPGRWWRCGAHLVVSGVLFVGLHSAYKWVNAGLIQHEIPHAGPAYYYDNGFHLLCFVGPIVEPGDFPEAGKAEGLFRDLPWDLGDFRRRGEHRWLAGGLIARVKAAYADPLVANRMCEETAWHAVRRDPVGELRLAWLGYADYWNRERLRIGMITDRGSDRELPEQLLTLLEKYFHLSGEGLPQLSTVTNRYFFAAWVWYLALLLSPLPALVAIAIAPRENRPGAILLLVFVSLAMAMIAAFSIVPTVRFLHSVAWLGMITLGVFAGRVEAWWRGRSRSYR